MGSPKGGSQGGDGRSEAIVAAGPDAVESKAEVFEAKTAGLGRLRRPGEVHLRERTAHRARILQRHVGAASDDPLAPGEEGRGLASDLGDEPPVASTDRRRARDAGSG